MSPGLSCISCAILLLNMEHYILDTNLFFNMEPGLSMGADTKTVLKNMTLLATRARSQARAQFYMPPRIVEEFLGFFYNPDESYVREFLSQVTIKAPTIQNVTFSAQTFYRLVDDIRVRSYRGLVVAEEELKSSASNMMGKEVLDKKSFEITVGAAVKTLRSRYRNATRHGFLDSLADLDLITLAQELGGFVVSCDEGVVVWGREFGIKELPPHLLSSRFDFLGE